MTVLTHTHQGVGTIAAAGLSIGVTTTVNIPIGDVAFAVFGYSLAGGLSAATCADNATGVGSANVWTQDQISTNAGSSGRLWVFRTNVTRAIVPGRTITVTWGTSSSTQRGGVVVFSTHGWSAPPSVAFSGVGTGLTASMTTPTVGPTLVNDSFVLTAYEFKGTLSQSAYTETSGKTAGTIAWGASGSTGAGADYSWTETSATGTQSGSVTLTPGSTQGWTSIILVYTASAGTIFTKTITGSAQFAGIKPKAATQRKVLAAVSFSGAEVAHPTGRVVTASFTPSGALARQLALFRTLTGALSFSGARTAATAYARTLVGAVFTPTGASSRIKSVSKAISGALSFVGAQTRLPAKVLTAVLAPVGVLNRALTLFRTLTGVFAPVGALNRQTSRKVTGALSWIGFLIESLPTTHFSAGFTPHGTVTNGLPARTLFASLDFAGDLGRDMTRLLVSSLVASGVMHTQYIPPLPPGAPGGGGFGALMSDAHFQRYRVDGKWRGVKRVRA